MRPQYHFRRSPQGLCAWNVRRLVELSRDLPREHVDIVDHARLMLDRDLSFPIILSSDGRIMDGMHRVCKALLENRADIEAVRFLEDPEPDYIGVHPDDLPYDE